jgi:hypothetical protein
MTKLAAAVALLALVTGGCGGGGRLSKADFQKKANAICKTYNDRITAVFDTTSPNNPKSLARGLDRAVGYLEHGTDDLASLKPPAQYDAKYKQLLRLNHEEILSFKEFASATRKNDLKARTRTIVKLRSQVKDSNRLAHGLGLKICAS